MATTYFQNHVVTITYEEELQLGTAIWDGFLSSGEFREAITTCIHMIEEYKPLRWLGDNRKMKVIRKADQGGSRSASCHGFSTPRCAAMPCWSRKTSLTEQP